MMLYAASSDNNKEMFSSMLHNLLALMASISWQAHAICPSDMLYVDQNDKSHLTTWNMQWEKNGNDRY